MCVDTITIYFECNKFKIRNRRQFNSIIKSCVSSEGDETERSYLCLNSKKDRLSGLPESVFIKACENSVYITYSPMKVLTGDNYRLPNFEDFMEANSIVRQKIETLLEVNFEENAKICRLDLAKDISPKYDFSAYFPMFTCLAGNRRAKHYDWGTTFLWKRATVEVCIYDKLKQIQDISGTEMISPGYNLFRVESRFKEAKLIREKIGINLLKNFTASKFNELNLCHQNMIRNVVLIDDAIPKIGKNYSPKELLLNLTKASRTNRRNVINTWLMICGLPESIAAIGGVDYFSDMLRIAGYSRSTVSNHSRALKKKLEIARSFRLTGAAPDSIPMLYAELVDLIMGVP